MMQQSGLFTAIRGPDGLHKNHISKVLLRWYRRCILLSVFDRCVLKDPYDPRGGSFTGPCVGMTIDEALNEYIRTLDEVPHHFQLHFMHGAEILGYQHPDPEIRAWWLLTYRRLVADAHLRPELEEEFHQRLSDDFHQWRRREVVTSDNVGVPPQAPGAL